LFYLMSFCRHFLMTLLLALNEDISMRRREFSKAAGAAAKTLTAAVVLCLGQAAGALEVAPYFHSWSGGTLTQAKQASGLNSATLAFAITNGSCALQPDLQNKLPDARSFVAAGGQFIISFGGAHGVYAETACNDDQLFTLMEKLMADSGMRRFDWEIEGNHVQDVASTARRTRVLARLQAKYPDLYTSFSLPGWLLGVSADSMNLLRTTAAAGVRIDMVNVMTMSFGLENLRTMVVPSTVAQASIITFKSAAGQVASIYPNKTPAQINAMMGMTPMVGKNDDGSTFSLADAQTIANFVKLNGIGLLSYWSFQRDRAQATSASTDLGSFSGVAQSDYQFYNIFRSAGGSVASLAAAAPVALEPASACGGSNWVQGQQYAAGSVVSYGGRQYVAKVANPGYIPTVSTYFWSESSCAGSLSAAALAACSGPSWVQGQQYAAGSVVSYGGKRYVAKYANPGYIPTVSTHYWSAAAC
jgi:hypothetical protein